jgi:hypothetical protein
MVDLARTLSRVVELLAMATNRVLPRDAESEALRRAIWDTFADLDGIAAGIAYEAAHPRGRTP